MDATELRALLGELAGELRQRRVQARVYLVGGAAMALAYDAARTTRDLDVLVLEGHGPVFEAAQVVARRHGLPGSWLNEQASAYLPSGRDDHAVVVFDAPGLSVLAASPERLLAMKAHAARAADADDLRLLCDRLGLGTAEDVEALAARVMPDQPLSARSKVVLRDLLATEP